MSNQPKSADPSSPAMTAMQSMHSLLLEALRHREQEVVRYLAILGPALGGFIWLLGYDGPNKATVFSVGTGGVILLMLLGAVYSLALGYNYRYITLELAKLESDSRLAMKSHVLRHWPRYRADFEKGNTVLRLIPCCMPPEIIKVFWLAFVLGILGVTHAAHRHLAGMAHAGFVYPVRFVGWACFVLAFAMPVWFGFKMRSAIRKEPADWDKEEDQGA